MAYSQEDKERIVNSVCYLMEQGKDFHQSCDEVDVYPTTLYRWFEKDDKLCEMYTRARDALIHLHTKELIDLSDKMHIDPARSRVQIDTRKWVLAKLMPKIFGDKVTLGGDKENPIQVEQAVNIYLPSNGRN